MRVKGGMEPVHIGDFDSVVVEEEKLANPAPSQHLRRHRSDPCPRKRELFGKVDTEA